MKILVTLDGSSLSEAALEPAKKIAEATNAEVHLMSVGEPPPKQVSRQGGHHEQLVHGAGIGVLQPTVLDDQVVSYPHTAEAERAEQVETYDRLITQAEWDIRRYLEDKAAIFGDRRVKLMACLGDDVAQEISDYAQQEAIDCIIMATHGRSGLSSLVQGSVASEVVRSGIAPVMLIRPAP